MPSWNNVTSIDRSQPRALDLRIAQEVQARLFPQEQPRHSGLDYFGTWRAARGISGDYLDYLDLPQGDLGIAIGDVAGKGLAAALLMSSLHSMVRVAGMSGECQLTRLAGLLNGHFLRLSPDNSFASLFLARYESGEGLLRFVNAGHEPPLVLRNSGSRPHVMELPATGPVIGMLRDARYQEESVWLSEGDLVVAYTDGVCDLRNPAGREWGKERLIRAIHAHRDLSTREIVRRVVREMELFGAGEPQFDDFTLWVGRVSGAEAVEPLEREEAIFAA